MLKFAIAVGSLMIAMDPSSAQVAAPRCVDADCPNPKGQEQSVKEADSARTAVSPACSECPLPQGFDSQEVLKKVRIIDHSKIINTVTVLPAGRRGKATRHLVLHLTEVRHVGVIQHNHTIIEKSIRSMQPSRHNKRYRRAPIKPNTWRSSYGSADIGAADQSGRARGGCARVYIPNGWTGSRMRSC
jgi:hypothetical protein